MISGVFFMLCEKILGKLNEFDTSGKVVEYVDIEWHEAFKRIHKKTTNTGRQVGIRLDDSVLVKGLYENDVIYNSDELIIVVHTPPCEVIRVSIDKEHMLMIAKVCYEIGNRHAPIFFEDAWTFITPYNKPMLLMLSKFHGVIVEKICMKLEFDKRISATVNNHHH